MNAGDIDGNACGRSDYGELRRREYQALRCFRRLKLCLYQVRERLRESEQHSHG